MTEPSPRSDHGPWLPLEYEGLQLPSFSLDEEQIRALEFNEEEFVSWALSRDGDPELMKKSGSHALRTIDDIVARFIQVKAAQTNVSPDLLRHLDGAVARRDWSGVEDHSAEQFLLRESVARSNRLRFRLINEWLSKAENTGLSEIACYEYRHVMPIMAAIDRMFIKLISERLAMSSVEREERGFINECAVVRMNNDGTFSEAPYHVAFKEETQVMVEGYRRLIDALEKCTTPAMQGLRTRKLAYYRAVLAALETSDPKKWKDADALLPGQVESGNDAIHIHPIETAYLEDRILRSPDLGLRIPDAGEQETQSIAEQTKETMLRSLQGSRMVAFRAVAKTIPIVKNSNAALRHFLGAGGEMDIKPAGQILPNEFEARVHGGIDSSLDMETVRERLPLQIQATEAVFGKKLFSTFFKPRIDLAQEIGGDTAAHELGHAVGLVDDTFRRLGGKPFVKAYIEEWKATTAGLVANKLIPFLEGGGTQETFVTWIAYHFRLGCRYASLRHLPPMAAYFRKSMMFFKVAEETGIVYATGNPEIPWDFNREHDRVMSFFDRLFKQFESAMYLYGEGKEDELINFLHEHLQPTQLSEWVCAHLPVPQNDEHTPTKLCTLPKDKP